MFQLLIRLTSQSSTTSTSIRVRRKQSSASSGRQTTGSFSLNEVFSTIGTPVRSPKALDQPVVARIGLRDGRSAGGRSRRRGSPPG